MNIRSWHRYVLSPEKKTADDVRCISRLCRALFYFLIQIEKFTHHFNLLTSIRSLVTDPEWETLYPEWPAGC